MNLRHAKSSALHLMREHGLVKLGWTFAWDRAVKRFGCCSYTRRQLTLSKKLVKLNEQVEVTNTILHEIAHALAGPGTHHGQTWKRVARDIGCSADRCYDSKVVVRPSLPWVATCPGCGRKVERARRVTQRMACGRCCPRFDARFEMLFSRAR